MSGNKHYEFSADRVFLWLFVFTAAEVAWGYAGDWLGWGKGLLWGGLILFAVFKAFLIAAYFMHLKFEGWIVKGLIIPTPFLIAVIMLNVSPDVSRNEKLTHEIGSMYDPDTGIVYEYMEHTSQRPSDHGGGDSEGGHGTGSGGEGPAH